MKITTKRLLLREFTLSDFDDFLLLMQDPEVMRFSISGPLSKDLAKERFKTRILAHYKEYGFGLWAVIHQETGKLIGYAGIISQLIDDKEEVEIGYRLLPAYWGLGLATEASLAICAYAFEVLHLKHLIAIIDPQNLRSLNVVKRIGMTYLKKGIFHEIPVDIYLLQGKEHADH